LSVPSTGLVFQPPGRLQQYSYEKSIYVRIQLYEFIDANYAENNEFLFFIPFIEYAYIIKEVCVDCVRFHLKIRKLDMNKALHIQVKSFVHSVAYLNICQSILLDCFAD